MSNTDSNPRGEAFAPERDTERPGANHPQFLAEDAQRVLTGTPVGGQLGVTCNGCDARLSNRKPVTVTIGRDDAGWTEPLVYCRDCTAPVPTDRGAVNVVASARLATVNTPTRCRNHLALSAVTITSFSDVGETAGEDEA